MDYFLFPTLLLRGPLLCYWSLHGLQKNKERYDLVLLHPQSLSKKKTLEDINKLKKQLSNKKTIFLYGNKDQNYQIIENYYKKLKAKKNSYIFYKTLPKEEYFGLVKYCDNFYTNTSSIYEIKHINKKSKTLTIYKKTQILKYKIIR